MAPTAHEIKRSEMAMGNGKSGGDAKLPAVYWKALMSDQLLLGYMCIGNRVAIRNLLRLLLQLVQLQHNSTPSQARKSQREQLGNLMAARES